MNTRHLDWPPFCDELFEKAQQLAGTTSSATIAANTMTIYSMLVLQRLLAQQAVDPINNLENIICITNSIANLSDSITII